MIFPSSSLSSLIIFLILTRATLMKSRTGKRHELVVESWQSIHHHLGPKILGVHSLISHPWHSHRMKKVFQCVRTEKSFLSKYTRCINLISQFMATLTLLQVTLPPEGGGSNLCSSNAFFSQSAVDCCACSNSCFCRCGRFFRPWICALQARLFYDHRLSWPLERIAWKNERGDPKTLIVWKHLGMMQIGEGFMINKDSDRNRRDVLSWKKLKQKFRIEKWKKKHKMEKFGQNSFKEKIDKKFIHKTSLCLGAAVFFSLIT